jgi:hypothetical protein
MKNPPCQSARRVSEDLLGNSKSSLAVFYVEQVALNRHVSPQPQLLLLCLRRQRMSMLMYTVQTGYRKGDFQGRPLQRAPLDSTTYFWCQFEVEFFASNSDIVSVLGPMKRMARFWASRESVLAPEMAFSAC